jgi:hypothetical protein
VQPFRLDAQSAAQPTEFEITFIVEGVRYQYGFAMTAQRIVREHLLVYKAFKPQRWFERHLDAEGGKDVCVRPRFEGRQESVGGGHPPNALFLSMAVQLNSEAMRPVFDWFSTGLVVFNEQAPLNPQTSIQMLMQADAQDESAIPQRRRHQHRRHRGRHLQGARAGRAFRGGGQDGGSQRGDGGASATLPM